MKKPMKTTDKITLAAVAAGVLGGLGTWWLLPDAHWGVYVLAGAIITVGISTGVTQQIANERLANRDTTDQP